MLFAEEPRVIRAWKRRWDADHYLRLLRWRDQGFCPEVIYDIGAHAGQWAEMCQSIFAPAEVILFEPQPELWQRAKLRQPARARWQVLPVALGDMEKDEVLHVTENQSASSILKPARNGIPSDFGTRHVEERQIHLETLDGVVAKQNLPRPDLVKIDVQGYEAQVIAGGERTLSQARAIITEVSLHPIYEEQALLPEIASALLRLGFELEDINETCREWSGRVWQVDLWLRRSR